MKKTAFLLFFSWTALIAAETIQVIPMEPTPQPVNASVRIARPEEGEVLSSNPVHATIRVRGYGLGDASQFPRRNEIPDSKMGQTLHIIVDDQPYFPYNGPALDPFNTEGDYYQEMYSVPLKGLKDGMHTLRVFACRSYGESLKTLECFDAVTFYMNNKKIDWSMSLRRPFLTYNEPSGYFTYQVGQPVFLDFYASNCEISSDGYKVKLTIDEHTHRMLTELRPYYIYGLKKGTHKIRLELVDAHDQLVPGAFNDITRSFSVK